MSKPEKDQKPKKPHPQHDQRERAEVSAAVRKLRRTYMAMLKGEAMPKITPAILAERVKLLGHAARLIEGA
jgi:hypothetical protein